MRKEKVSKEFGMVMKWIYTIKECVQFPYSYEFGKHQNSYCKLTSHIRPIDYMTGALANEWGALTVR